MVKMEEDPTLTKRNETSGLGLCPESQKERGDQSARTYNHFRSANHSIYHAVEKDSMHIGRVFLIRLSHCRQERMGKGHHLGSVEKIQVDQVQAEMEDLHIREASEFLKYSDRTHQMLKK